MAKYITYCDIVRAGACLDGVIRWCKGHGDTFWLTIDQATAIGDEWINKALWVCGDGDGYGDGNGDGYGDGNGDNYGNGNGTSTDHGSGSGNGYGSGLGNGYGEVLPKEAL